MTFPLEPERKREKRGLYNGRADLFLSRVWHISPSPWCQANQIHLKSIPTCRPQTRSHTIASSPSFPIRTQPGESIDFCETQRWPPDQPPASGSNHFVASIIAPGGLRASGSALSLSVLRKSGWKESYFIYFPEKKYWISFKWEATLQDLRLFDSLWLIPLKMHGKIKHFWLIW